MVKSRLLKSLIVGSCQTSDPVTFCFVLAADHTKNMNFRLSIVIFEIKWTYSYVQFQQESHPNVSTSYENSITPVRPLEAETLSALGKCHTDNYSSPNDVLNLAGKTRGGITSGSIRDLFIRILFC